MIPAPFLLKLLGLWGTIKRAAAWLVGKVVAYPKEAAIIALALAFAWAWRGWSAEEAGREKDRKHCASTIDAIGRASAKNLADAWAQKREVEAKSQAIAKETDDAYNAGKADALRAADRHIAANRVRKDQVYRSTPAAPSEDHNTGSVESPGAETELVAVSADDVRICSENTARLEAAREWADRLVKAGLAE